MSEQMQDHARNAVLLARGGGNGMSVSAASTIDIAPKGCVAADESVWRSPEEDQQR